MEVLERLLAAKATVEAEDVNRRGAPELGTRPEGSGIVLGSRVSQILKVYWHWQSREKQPVCECDSFLFDFVCSQVKS